MLRPLQLLVIASIFAGCMRAPVRLTVTVPTMPETKSMVHVTAESPRDVSRELQVQLQKTGIPGAVVVVLRGDNIIAQGAAGVRKQGTATPVTIDDQFEICSCAKAMTATLVARYVERGSLRWDTTIGELFGDLVPDMNAAWRTVPIDYVLTHRAGMKDHLVIFARTLSLSRGDPRADRLLYIRKILRGPPDYTPGSKFLYSSTDYLLLGAMLEKLSGRTFEEVMAEELFAPLAMTTAGFGAPGSDAALDQPWGHGLRRLMYIDVPFTGVTSFAPKSPQADFPLVASPAGLIHMSVHDWAAFVSLHLRGEPTNPQAAYHFLQPDTFAHLHHGVGTDGYAPGWLVSVRPWAKGKRPDDVGRVLFHMGDNGRWNCVVWIAPEIDFAVLVACNRARSWGEVDKIASKLVGEFAQERTASISAIRP